MAEQALVSQDKVLLDPQVGFPEFTLPPRTEAAYAILEEASDILYAATKRRIVRDVDARSRHQFREAPFIEWPQRSQDFWLERVVSNFGWLELDFTRRECPAGEEKQLAKMAGALFVHSLQARIRRTGSLQNAWQTEEFLTAKMQEELQELSEAREKFISLLPPGETDDFVYGFPRVETDKRLSLVTTAFRAAKMFGVSPLTLMQFVVAKQEARIAKNKVVLSDIDKQQLWQDLLPIAKSLFGDIS